MKNILLLSFSLFIISISCNKKQNNTQQDFKNNSKELQNKKDIRDGYNLKFENGDSINNIVSNFFPKEKIDSFSKLNATLKGKYYYCFKGGISQEIVDLLKQNEKGINTNTAHNIIIKDDTIPFNGRQNLDCLNENDSILIKTTIFTFYQKNYKTNLMIIDDFIKICISVFTPNFLL